MLPLNEERTRQQIKMDFVIGYYLGVVTSETAIQVGTVLWAVLKPASYMLWAGAQEALCPSHPAKQPPTIDETFSDDDMSYDPNGVDLNIVGQDAGAPDDAAANAGAPHDDDVLPSTPPSPTRKVTSKVRKEQ